MARKPVEKKRKRGRPRKNPVAAVAAKSSPDDPPKRKRGRPRKHPLPEDVTTIPPDRHTSENGPVDATCVQEVVSDESLQNDAPLENAKRHQAALLLAEDLLPDREIGRICGVTRQSVSRWKRDPAFLALVQKHAAEIHETVAKIGIADKSRRIRMLNSLAQKIWATIEARAADRARQKAPGADQGLLAQDFRGSVNIREVYQFDSALVKELREILTLVAKEMGQLTDKLALTDPTGEESWNVGPVSVDISGNILEALYHRLAPPEETNGHANGEEEAALAAVGAGVPGQFVETSAALAEPPVFQPQAPSPPQSAWAPEVTATGEAKPKNRITPMGES